MKFDRDRRTEKVSAVMTPALLARLARYADRHSWSISNAIVQLVRDGLDRDDKVGNADEHA